MCVGLSGGKASGPPLAHTQPSQALPTLYCIYTEKFFPGISRWKICPHTQLLSVGAHTARSTQTLFRDLTFWP